MNNKVRSELREVIERLEAIQWQVQCLQEDEQAKFDELPEGLQETDRAQSIYEAAENLESALDSLEDVIDSINQAIEV